MTAAELIRELHRLDVRVHGHDGKLKVDAPEGVLTAGLVAKLRVLKEELLQLVSVDGDLAGRQAETEPNDHPLSLAQHAFYMLEQRYPNLGAYNLLSARRLRLPVDPVKLERALRAVIERHEILRTVFVLHDGSPMQRVLRSAAPCFDFRDLSNLPEEERERELTALLDRRQADAFDLEKGPLLRTVLARTGHDEHVLVVAMHHIISDAASLDLFYSELLHAYEALDGGEAAPRVQPPQYARYALEQSRRFEAGRLEQQIQFWIENLENLPQWRLGKLEVGAPPIGSCFNVQRALRPARMEAVDRFAQEARVTHFVVMMAAYQVLLARLSGSPDIPVITPVSGRVSPELSGTLGLFVSSVVVRGHVQRDARVGSLLAQLSKAVGQALDNQEISLEVLEGALRKRGIDTVHLERLPRVAFNHIRATGTNSATSRVDAIPLERDRAVFDLMLIATETPTGSSIKLEVREGVLCPDEAEAFVDDYISLLEHLCDSSTTPLRELGVLEACRRGIAASPLDPGEYTRARAMALSGHDQPTVVAVPVSCTKPLRMNDLFDAVRTLVERVPRLGEHVIAPRRPLLDVPGRAAEPDFDPATRVRRIAAAGPDEISELMSVAQDVREPFGSTPWCVVASDAVDTITPLWVLAAEPLFDKHRATCLAQALAALLRDEEPSQITEMWSPRTRSEPAGAAAHESQHELTPLRAPGHASAAAHARTWVESRHLVRHEQLDEWQRFCDRRQVELADLLRIATGVIAAMHGRGDGAFQMRYREDRHREGVDGFAVLPATVGTADGNLEWLVDAPGVLDVASCERLAEADRWTRNEWDVALQLESEETGIRVLPPDGQILVRAAPSDQGLGVHVAAWEGQLPDPYLPRRLASIADQIARGTTRVEELELVLPEERTLFYPFPEAPPHDTPNTLHGAFIRAARTHPDRIAVWSGERALTYSELDRYSDDVARRLQARGAGPGATVGVLLPRTEELLVGLLGVMKAGCTYVPLDARQPSVRLREMLRRAEVSLVVTDRATEGPLGGTTIDRLRLDEDSGPPPQRTGQATTQDGSTAYVIYTSGSTGAPKGVAVPHSAAAGFLSAMQRRPGIRAEDVMLAVTTISFDISVLELFLPISAGGAVVIADEASVADGERLLELVERHGVTILQATPTTWELLLAAGLDKPRQLTALCGGEAMPPNLARRLRRRVRSLWNMYGPTEATVWATAHRLTTDATPIPVGKPVDGAALYSVDRAGRCVPPGVWGEIHIAGPCLASGYLGDSTQSNERFAAWRHPSGQSLLTYRTGDQGYVDREGVWFCGGRLDRQVKLRGHRLELAEIEHALRLHADVLEAAVVLEGAGTEDARLCAYVQNHPTSKVSRTAMREWLETRLPPYAVPGHLSLVQELPRLANGKLDTTRLRSLELPSKTHSAPPSSQVEATLMDIWESILGERRFDVHDNFFDVGGHSLLLLRVQRQIQERLDAHVDVVDLFTHSSIERLARHVERIRDGRTARPATLSASEPTHHDADDAVAIIGMACTLPGASDLETFWSNLRGGKESIAQLSERELREAGVPAALLHNPAYIRAAPRIPDVDCFDTALFRMTPREARQLDPQHRLLLQCSYAALEDAGLDPTRSPDRVGVFAGVGFSYYLMHRILTHAEALASASPLDLLYANDKDYAATRLAYKLDLRGPAVSLGTACSTGLVAVHQACRSLRAGDCDVALAGAARVSVPQTRGYLRAAGGILSPDGHCRAFDAEASGTLFGNGVGAVVLKPLKAALRDGDPIYCLVRSSAVNNDGVDKAGFTAPSKEGQIEVISSAWRQAGMKPSTASYIEAHGTGTPLGDAIELAALNQIFDASECAERIALGSVKTNFGHLDTAAGIAGLIKTALALWHSELPPSLHFRHPNPLLGLDRSALEVNATLRAWDGSGGSRRAGVSSFGIGGTNAHVVLESFDDASRVAAQPQPRPQLLLLSGASDEAARNAGQRLAAHLESREANLPDVAATLATGRRALTHRSFVVAESSRDAARALRDVESAEIEETSGSPGVIWLLAGHADLYAGMARALYEREPVFAHALDEAVEWAHAEGLRLKSSFLDLNGPGFDDLSAQPALYAFQLALGRLLQTIGCAADVLVGHGFGELAAGALSGVFSERDGMRLVIALARALEGVEAGRLLAVRANPETLSGYRSEEVAFASYDAPSRTVLGGPTTVIERLRERLHSAGIAAYLLPGHRARHTRFVAATRRPLHSMLSQLNLSPPTTAVACGSTASWLSPAEATNPEHWAELAVRPVRFANAIAEVSHGRTGATTLELGPGATLSQLLDARFGAASRAITPIVEASEQAQADTKWLREMGRLWQLGHAPNWGVQPQTTAAARRRLRLPTYPFAKQSHWWEGAESGGASEPLQRQSADAWLYEPSWTRKARPHATADGLAGTWLILALPDESSTLCSALERAAHANGDTALRVFPPGCKADAEDPGARVLGAETPEAWEALLGALPGPICHIVHTWGISRQASLPNRDYTFYSLLHLAQALASRGERGSAQLVVVSRAVHRVTGDERLRAEQALSLGVTRVLTREVPGLRVSHLDFVHLDAAETSEAVRAELAAGLPDPCVAFRGAFRWIPTYQPRKLPHETAAQPTGAPVYVVTGGAGGIGSSLCRHLAARSSGAHFVLLGRRRVEHVSDQLETIRQKAGSVVYHSGNVACETTVRQVVEDTLRSHRRITTVIHAAGCADGRLVPFQDRTQCERVLRPKVDGARALLAAIQGRPVGRLVLFSSVTAETGDPGQLGYCAANAYLDAFAEEATVSGVPTVSIGWDTWREVGMAASAEVPATLRGAHARRLELGLTDEEGCDLFVRLSGQEDVRWVVSTTSLAKRLERTARTTSPAQRPRAAVAEEPTQSPEDVHRTVARLWCESFGVDTVGPEADFFALGGSSLQAVNLADTLSRVLGTTVLPDAVLRHPSVRLLAEHLVDRRSASRAALPDSTSDVVQLREGSHESATAMFLVHPIGGEVFVYRALAAALRTPGPVFAIRQDRATHGRRVDELAARYLELARRICPGGRFALGGSSFGGTIAFEMAQQLRLVGEQPPLVALLDTPHGADLDQKLADDVDILCYLASGLHDDVGLTRCALEAQPSDGLLAYFLQRARSAGLDEAFNEQTLRIYLDAFKGNDRAMREYVPKSYPGRVLYIKAPERRPRYDPPSPERHWLPLCEDLRLVETSGNHITMHEPPQVERTAALLDDELALLTRTATTVEDA